MSKKGGKEGREREATRAGRVVKGERESKNREGTHVTHAAPSREAPYAHPA